MAFDVSGLSSYVQEKRELVLKDFVLGAPTIERMTIQPGIKKSANLNFLNVDPTWQDGSSCGWSADGDAAFTKRVIETGAVKINMAFCDKDLLGYWAEYVVRFGANNEEFPFEEYILKAITDAQKLKMEKAIWQSDTANSDFFDGLLAIITADANVINESISAGTSAYDAIYQVYNAIPEEILGKPDLAINVSPKIFRAFCKELTDMNMYHYTAGEKLNEIVLPGTTCTVKCVQGLADPNGVNDLYIVATYDRNLVYGCDMVSDAEELKAWYSVDNDEFRIKAVWNSGTQVAFPDLVVLGTMAAAPNPSTRALDALKAIADNTGELADANHVFKTKEQP